MENKKKTIGKVIAQNRKAYHDYFVEEKYEAGIVLFGTEIKSLRAGTVNLKDSFCSIKNGELYALGIHISPYEKGNIFNRDPLREKKAFDAQKRDFEATRQSYAGRLYPNPSFPLFFRLTRQSGVGALQR